MIKPQDRKIENHFAARVGDVCVAKVPTGGVMVGIVLTIRDGIACKIKIGPEKAAFVDNFEKLVEPIENFRPEVKFAVGEYLSHIDAGLKLHTYLTAEAAIRLKQLNGEKQ